MNICFSLKSVYWKCENSHIFILNIFSVSLFSSFYNLLCSLEILKNDPFYGKSVEVKSFRFEHKIRIGLSKILT